MSQGLWGRGESQEQEDSLAVSSVCLPLCVNLCMSLCFYVCLSVSVSVY